MQEFRGTANEFKETWEREVDFEGEIKAFDPDSIEAESKSVPRISSISPESEHLPEPMIKEADPAALDRLKAAAESDATSTNGSLTETIEQQEPSPSSKAFEPTNDKRNWL